MRVKVKNIYGKEFSLKAEESLYLIDMDGISKIEKLTKEDEPLLRQYIRDMKITPYAIDEDKGIALYLVVFDKTRILAKRTLELSNKILFLRAVENKVSAA